MAFRGSLFCVLFAGLIFSGSAAAQEYTITDLDGFDGYLVAANAINNLGQITGIYEVDDCGTTHAFIFTDRNSNNQEGLSTFLDLGTLEGNYSEGAAINDLGQVAGWAATVVTEPCAYPPSGTEHAFFWRGQGPIIDGVRRLRDLGTLGGEGSWVGSINNHGVVVGWSDTLDGTQRAFRWKGRRLEELSILGDGTSAARDINDQGQIVGYATDTEGWEHAFLLIGNKLIDLGGLGGDYSIAYAVNENGLVVGRADLPGEELFHACLWRGGEILDLGTLEDGPLSGAFDINNSEQVIGISRTWYGGYLPFLWENGVMMDLHDLLPDDSPWLLMTVSAINDRGQIIGLGEYDGFLTTYLMTPVSQEANSIRPRHSF